MKVSKRTIQEINVSTTADIAFLLLIFFLVTTTIVVDKGLQMKLPPKVEEEVVKIKERNLFKIQINSNNQIMVNEAIRSNLNGMVSEIKEFVLNKQHHHQLSESPKKAIVSLKTNRGTSYASFIDVLDEIKGAYYEIYAERAGMSANEYRQLDTGKENELAIYNLAKEGIPMNISIAEPN